MSGDTLTYDMSSMSEGSPSIFVKKDWLSILDNQSGSYAGNQSVIDTSQLANSNKYMNYREAYLAVPMVLTVSGTAVNQAVPLVAAGTVGNSADMAFGLKNWFGTLIHSMTLDFQGTTIIQQTPFINMWNSFKLMTSLSWGDVITQGATMGFYPDDPLSWSFIPGTAGAATGNAVAGVGTCNNANLLAPQSVSGAWYSGKTGNEGLLARQRYIAYDPDGFNGGAAVTTGLVGSAASSTLLSAAAAAAQYKSYISTKTTHGAAAIGCLQYSIMATIHLKHLHSFFQNIPLLKGVFMKATITLNQPTVTFTCSGAAANNYAQTTVSVSVPSGGCSPLMVASGFTANGAVLGTALGFAVNGAVGLANLSVGNRSLDSRQSTLATGQLGTTIQLYVPAYTFNGPFESAYLASPVKKISYTDVYQYQVTSVSAGATFNQLITNGIANIKSVLVMPFFTQTANAGLIPWQSPFDPAGAGPTSPLCLLTNFNVVVAGQNAIYNTQRYSYEQFINQLYGANAVNAGLTDGLTSALFDKLGFENEYCYYYVNTSRMMPVEEAVPKSVSITGTNNSAKEVTLMVFIEYGVEISVDVLSGARV